MLVPGLFPAMKNFSDHIRKTVKGFSELFYAANIRASNKRRGPTGWSTLSWFRAISAYPYKAGPGLS